MTHVNITKKLRQKLYEYSSFDETVDEAVNRLLDEVGDISDDVIRTGTTGITLNDNTIKRIKSNAIKF